MQSMDIPQPFTTPLPCPALTLTRRPNCHITHLALRIMRNGPLAQFYRQAIPRRQQADRLVKKDLIEPENGSFVIVDRFLRLWIRTM